MMAERERSRPQKNAHRSTFRAPKSRSEQLTHEAATSDVSVAGREARAAAASRRTLDDENEELWLRRSKLDREKFFYFYEKYFDAIYRFVYWKTLDRQVAEDLTADTFVTALEKLAEFEWKGYSFGSWLHRIALNEVNYYLRRMARWRLSKVDEIKELASSQQSPLTQLILTEEQQQVYRCLEELEPEAQDLFLLYYWQGLKLREIAGILGKNLETVKSQLQRSRKVMAARLAEFDRNE